jgi:hypothetical protein
VATSQSASAQITYSIDWKSQTVSQLSSTVGAPPITESDALSPPAGAPAFGPLQKPAQRLTGSFFNLQNYASCVGHAPGTPCEIEVDALSSGLDDRFHPNQLGTPTATTRRRVWFSVDEWAAGNVATPTSPAHASVFNQGNPSVPPGSPGVFEACADVAEETPNAGSAIASARSTATAS